MLTPMSRPPTPKTLDDITPGWLTRALRFAEVLSSEQSVVRVERGRGAGGIPVTSRVSRLTLQYDPGDALAPRSLFVKVTNPDYDGHDSCAREVRFYRDLAPDVDLPVPRCGFVQRIAPLEDISDPGDGFPSGKNQRPGVVHDFERRKGMDLGLFHSCEPCLKPGIPSFGPTRRSRSP